MFEEKFYFWSFLEGLSHVILFYFLVVFWVVLSFGDEICLYNKYYSVQEIPIELLIITYTIGTGAFTFVLNVQRNWIKNNPEMH